jgi:hypothetical protein
MSLQPQDISDNFNLTEINARITALMSSISIAEQSASDQFMDTQATQAVRRQKLSDLNDSLGIWLKAKSIKTGLDSSCADLVASEFNPAWPRV